MKQLQTKSGQKLFSAVIGVKDVEIHKDEDGFVAVQNGAVIPGTVIKLDHENLNDLVPAIDPTKLIGKDPTTLSQDELIALTSYLQSLAAGKLNVSDDKEATSKAEAAAEKKAGKKKKKAAPAPVEEESDEDEEETESDVALPEGVETYDDLAGLGARELWKIAKPLDLEGINSRSKKDVLVAALAEHFGLTEEDDDDEEEDALPAALSGEEDEEEYDEEDEDDDEDEEEDDESEEDDEDEFEDDEDDEEDEEEEDLDDVEEDEDEDDEDDDEEEDEDDDEEDDFEDDEEDEDDEDELTPEDIDAMETKEEIMAVIRKHDIQLPKKRLNVRKVKAFIKDALFGEEE